MGSIPASSIPNQYLFCDEKYDVPSSSMRDKFANNRTENKITER